MEEPGKYNTKNEDLQDIILDNEWLKQIVRTHYVPINNPKDVDGAMMWEDSWWAPKFGCDTLDNLLDAIEHIVNRRVKIASRVAKMYFTIASDAIGEEQVRKDRDAYMAKRGM